MRILHWFKCIAIALSACLIAGSALASAELNRQGMAAYQRGDMQEAARLFEAASASFTSTVGERHPDTLNSLNNLAGAYRALGRTAEQLALNEKVLKLRTEILGERHQPVPVR